MNHSADEELIYYVACGPKPFLPLSPSFSHTLPFALRSFISFCFVRGLLYRVNEQPDGSEGQKSSDLPPPPTPAPGLGQL